MEDQYNTGTYEREFPRGQVLRGIDTQNPTTRTIQLPVTTSVDDRTLGVIHQGMVMSLNADGTQWVKGSTSTSDTTIVAVAHTDSYQDDIQAGGTLLGLQCSGQYRFATPFFKHYTAEGEKITKDGADSTTKYNAATLCTYKAGTPLTICDNAETDVVIRNVQGQPVAVTVSCAGYVRPAKTGEVIIGVVAQTQYGAYRPTEYRGVAGSNYGTPATNRDLTGFAVKKSDGTIERHAVDSNYAACMPTGVMPLRTTIGSSIDSSSKIYNAYWLVWDSAQSGAKA